MGVFWLPFFLLMATSTIDTDTELSAVNSILGAIGQSPVTNLDLAGNPNPEISFIYNILTEVNKDVQNEGWHFNTEDHIKITLASAGEITVPQNTLRYDFHNGLNDKLYDVVTRDGKLYDLVEHTSTFEAGDYYIDAVTLYKFADLPNAFQRYITHRAATRAATQLVSNPQLVQLLQTQEALARATCMELECDKGDNSFFGVPDQSRYNSYKPYDALRR